MKYIVTLQIELQINATNKDEAIRYAVDDACNALLLKDTNVNPVGVRESRPKPFDVDRAKRGDKVITRSGSPARIVCFDVDNSQPILALVMDCGEESAFSYDNHGFYFPNGATPSDYDLIMAE